MNLVYPRRCAVCDDIVVPKEAMVCISCYQEIQWIEEPRCKKCGKPVEEEIEFCFDCERKKFHYIKGFPLCIYDKNMHRSIATFKYKGRKEYGVFYAQSISKKYGKDFEKLQIDALIPVPIHKSRKNERGYNQAEVIARELEKSLKIPVMNDLLIRDRKTLPQKELNDKERKENLAQAFDIINIQRIAKSKIKRVIVVDDIYTTGSTIEGCTKVLLNAGIEQVYFTSVCIGMGM